MAGPLNGNGNGHGNGNGNGHGNGHSAVLGARFDPGPSFADRLPPHSIEAEMSVLGSILLEEERLIEVLDQVDTPDFYRGTHQVIFQAIKDLFDVGAPIDGVTLASQLVRQEQFDKVGGNEALREIIESVPHAANAQYYAGIVRELAEKRRLLEGHHEVIRAIYSGQQTAPELIDLAGRKLASVSRSEEEADDSLFGQPAPAPMAMAAFHGLAGRIIDLVEPQTEACREAILGQFLVAFGNMVGKRAHWTIEPTRHWCNLFLCIVGASSVARKGTAWDIALWLLERLDPEWAAHRVMDGQSTGEGLIAKVRDAEYDEDGHEIEKGVSDKRAMFVESEFGGTLTLMGRDGNSLSSVVRKAWDGKTLMTCPKHRPHKATGAHVSIVGHVTKEELQYRLSQADRVNGYANRFLWLHAYRTKLLPRGGTLHPHLFADVERELALAHEFATRFVDPDRPFRLHAEAERYWDDELYPRLTAAQLGDYGQAIKRGAPLVMRIAVIYAILDRESQVRLAHLRAAMAFWDYCDRTAACIFAGKVVDRLATKALEVLRAAPDGLTRNEIGRRAFSGHKPPEEVDRILLELLNADLAAFEKTRRGRCARMVWRPK